MNKKILLFSATLGISYLCITSYDDGPAKAGANLTGAGSSTATCGGAGCHAAASSVTTGTFALQVKSTGAPVLDNKYVAGTTYRVILSGTNGNLLPKFGFQMAATKSDNTNVGTLTATAANTIVRTVGSLKIGEHTAPLTGSTGMYTVSFDWVAPAAGTGTVTFYGIINAVNGTGTTSGDEPSSGFSKAFSEKTASIKEQVNLARSISPNPCTSVLTIEAATSAKIMTTVYDLNGRQVIAPSHQTSIDVSSLSAGVYMLRLSTEEGHQMATFVKQ